MIYYSNKGRNSYNNGFTLVELIIGLVIVAIIAAIAIPVTLSIIDNSDDANLSFDAKSIWTAAQSVCNDQLANDEHWLGTSNKVNNVEYDIGLILNEYSRGENKNYTRNDFEGHFIYIGDTDMAKSILSKIDNVDTIKHIYVFTGRYGDYYSSDEYRKSYTVYLIAFNYKNSDKMYFYNGKEVSTNWPFSNPIDLGSFSPSAVNEMIKIKTIGGKEVVLQAYSLIGNTQNEQKKTATLFKTECTS